MTRILYNPTTTTLVSRALRIETYTVFGKPADKRYSNPRLAFYSIGESINLNQLDSRVSTLINSIATAIP